MRHGGTLIHVHRSRLQKVKGDLEQKSEKEAHQSTRESAPDCQQHQSDQSSDNEEISHSKENSPESTSDEDTESEPLEQDKEYHPHDIEKMTITDPKRIEPGQIITSDQMDSGTKISAKVLRKARKATESNKNWSHINTRVKRCLRI